MSRKLLRKLLLTVALAGAAVGLAHFISGLVYVPELNRFEATGELAKTEYRVGEQIRVEPFLTYTGMRRVTISSGRPLLFVEVYTAENVRILEVPELWQALLQFHTLKPNVPYNEKDRWPDYTIYDPDYLNVYSFSLKRAGSYKVVVRADFGLDKDDPAQTSRVYSEPTWVQITG